MLGFSCAHRAATCDRPPTMLAVRGRSGLLLWYVLESGGVHFVKLCLQGFEVGHDGEGRGKARLGGGHQKWLARVRVLHPRGDTWSRLRVVHIQDAHPRTTRSMASQAR
jgi:hypothetical protein